ncbi:MAG: hypothetical protein HFJ48_00610 [Clostridia bacterium]|nr:hypothetical protein [Clostridia bacterium]
MLFVNLFNDALKKVPSIGNALEKLIQVQKWDEKRTEYAIDIVQQLKKSSLRNSNPPTLEVVFEPLYLTLVSTEIGEISKEWDMDKVECYVKELINNINELSSEIVFCYARYEYDESVCEIEIYWYI